MYVVLALFHNICLFFVAPQFFRATIWGSIPSGTRTMTSCARSKKNRESWRHLLTPGAKRASAHLHQQQQQNNDDLRFSFIMMSMHPSPPRRPQLLRPPLLLVSLLFLAIWWQQSHGTTYSSLNSTAPAFRILLSSVVPTWRNHCHHQSIILSTWQQFPWINAIRLPASTSKWISSLSQQQQHQQVFTTNLHPSS